MWRYCLVVSEEESTRRACAEAAQSLRIRPIVHDSFFDMVGTLGRESVAAAVVDFDGPWARCLGCQKRGETCTPSILQFVHLMAKGFPDTPFVLIGAPESVPVAARRLYGRRFWTLTKPVTHERVGDMLKKLIQPAMVACGSSDGGSPSWAGAGLGRMIGNSARMREVYEFIAKVGGTRHPVLIMGETGTGKELVARAIHACSEWRDQPFVPVDPGGLTATLIESELFGHVRGAFTGAVGTRRGLLSLAGQGTVFLDEIADLARDLQVKLLRVLQEREFRPVGAGSTEPLQARVLAATNRDLERAVRCGRFRDDLFYRLNVLSVTIPPLRDRRDDIPILARHFLRAYRTQPGQPAQISAEALGRLLEYCWPGNVRELENCIKRAVTLGSAEDIGVADLPREIAQRSGKASIAGPVLSLKEVEKRTILDAVQISGGNRVRAAKLLGIGKTSIYRKLAGYGREGRT